MQTRAVTMPENHIRVFAGVSPVGSLYCNPEGRMSFTYDIDWLQADGAYPISVSLPLREQAYPPERAHCFFANLLPEGLVRQTVCREFGISEDNDFGLLSRIGHECAGALWIGSGEPPDPRTWRYEPVTDDELVSFSRAGGVFSSLVGKGRLRLSLAGAQDKLPVALSNDGYLLLPMDATPSTHILKFPNRGYSDLGLNEVFTTALARAVGMQTVDTVIRMVGNVPACLVKRYDRIQTGDGSIIRLHQEDMCQAMGLPSTRKYQAEGGPSFRECMELAEHVCPEPVVVREKLLGWLVFGLIIGNGDGHAKNLSLLYNEDGSMSLAPFYDMVCTLRYRNPERSLALRIGSRSDPGMIGPCHFDELASECGFGAGWLRKFVRDLAEGVCDALESVLQKKGLDGLPVSPVQRAVTRQARSVKNRFSQS